jgi:hypothetical protein
MIRFISLYYRSIGSCLSISFLLFFNSNCFSQKIVSTQKTNEEIFLARIKQFNEFLDRFNYKTDFNGNQVDSVFKRKMPRGKFLNSIFDLKDKRILSGVDSYSKSYIDLKSAFIDEVLAGGRKINKYSPNIIAEARSRIVYKNAPQTISIFLSQEIIGENKVKWVILDVKGDIMNFLKADTAYVRFIPPTSNETDFINLKRALEDSDHLQYYASRDFRFDPVSVFFYCINSKLIRFEYVEQVIYHILDIPGWCIKVRDFNRNELNSGWLISDVGKNSLDRISYLKTLK